MPWLQLSVTTNRDHTEQVEHALLQQGAHSITYRDAEDAPILEPAPGETPIWEHSIVTGVFDSDADVDTLLTALSIALEDCECSIHSEMLEDQNWVRAWMEHYKPMQFGQRLWIVPTHLEPCDHTAVNLRLDPGLAFGTGTHPTTALCLQWLEANIADQNCLLDYGCGSGILAIAALMLGMQSAVGVDIEGIDAGDGGHLDPRRFRLFEGERLPRLGAIEIELGRLLAAGESELRETVAGAIEGRDAGPG